MIVAAEVMIEVVMAVIVESFVIGVAVEVMGKMDFVVVVKMAMLVVVVVVMVVSGSMLTGQGKTMVGQSQVMLVFFSINLSSSCYIF